MRKLTTSGGAGMIGGVRSPMASPNHGLVGRSKLKPAMAGAPHRSAAKGTTVSSPQKTKDNV